MSPAVGLAQSWTCDDCGVIASRIDREPVPLPTTWIETEEGCFCLGCRRRRAGERALEAAPGSPLNARAKLRRTALIEFEVSRTPEEPDGTIARACRTSIAVVSQARRRLQLPDPSPPGPKSRAKLRGAASR